MYIIHGHIAAVCRQKSKCIQILHWLSFFFAVVAATIVNNFDYYDRDTTYTASSALAYELYIHVHVHAHPLPHIKKSDNQTAGWP